MDFKKIYSIQLYLKYILHGKPCKLYSIVYSIYSMYLEVNTLSILYIYSMYMKMNTLYSIYIYTLYIYSIYTQCIWRWMLYVYFVYSMFLKVNTLYIHNLYSIYMDYGGVENWKEMKDINPTLCIIAHLNLNRVGGIVRWEG